MDIRKLLTIETDAQEAMNAMIKEEAQIRRKIAADLARRVAEIEAEGKHALEMLHQDSSADTQAKIAKIKAEYAAKAQEFTSLFSANRYERRRRIFHDVLRG